MSDLKDLLHGAGEAKRQLFASEDFAGGYGHAVIGRVKRRRVVSATAMGGASVVAVGAVAVGASQVPWGGFVMGASPSGSPSVVCTTSTPDAAAGSDVSVPDGATLAVVDNASVEVVFVGWVDGSAVAWSSDGTTVPLSRAAGFEGYARLQLASGEPLVVRTEDGTGWVAPAHASKVTVFSVEAYLSRLSSSVSVSAEDGTVLGKAVHASDNGFVLIADGKIYPLVDPDGVTYAYVNDSGETVRVSLVDDNPSGGNPKATAAPLVTCATTTPEPSAAPSATPSTSPSTAAAPTSTPALTAGSGDSPFQCGFEMASDHAHGDNVSITDISWIAADEARTKLAEFYTDFAISTIEPSTKPVPVVSVGFTFPTLTEAASGMVGSDDPGSADSARWMDADSALGSVGSYVEGAEFVLVDGNVVVGTLRPQTLDALEYFDIPDRNSFALYELGLTRSAFDACDGVDPATLQDSQLYVVAGLKVLVLGEQMAPEYAWQKLQIQDN